MTDIFRRRIRRRRLCFAAAVAVDEIDDGHLFFVYIVDVRTLQRRLAVRGFAVVAIAIRIARSAKAARFLQHRFGKLMMMVRLVGGRSGSGDGGGAAGSFETHRTHQRHRTIRNGGLD